MWMSLLGFRVDRCPEGSLQSPPTWIDPMDSGSEVRLQHLKNGEPPSRTREAQDLVAGWACACLSHSGQWRWAWGLRCGAAGGRVLARSLRRARLPRRPDSGYVTLQRLLQSLKLYQL